ncbi:MAG: DUF454 family protein [Pseudomonadales bacterium]
MIKRVLLFALGSMLVLVGLIGLLVPVLPGVLFLLLAAPCFAALSPRWQGRLARHPIFRGWQLRWRQSRGLPLIARIRLAFWLTAEAALAAVRRV